MTTIAIVTGAPGQLAGTGVIALGAAWAAVHAVRLWTAPPSGSHHKAAAPRPRPLRYRLATTWHLACLYLLMLRQPSPSGQPDARPATPGRAAGTAPSGGGGAVPVVPVVTTDPDSFMETAERIARAQLAAHERRRDWGHDDPADALPPHRVCPAALSHLVAQAEEASA